MTIGGGLFPEGQDMAFSRSLTERRVSPRHNVILDRLSERGKVILLLTSPALRCLLSDNQLCSALL